MMADQIPPGVPAPADREDAEILQAVKRNHIKRLKELEKLSQAEQFNVNGKTYQRRKITAGEHRDLDQLRASWADLKTRDVKEAAIAYNKIYVTGAKYFLNMEEADYYQCAFEEIRDLVDALSHRVEYGTFLSTTNSASSSSAGK